MPLKHTSNPFLVDLFPPFKKPVISVYGSIAEVIAVVLILLVLFEALSFREPLISVIFALCIFVWFSNRFNV